jgi:hypothetical protein
MSVETKLMLMCLLLLAAAFVYGVMKVLGAWVEHHLTRHDLIVESKQRRIDYRRALAERDRELMEAEMAEDQSNVIIEEEAADEPALAQAA